MFSGLDQNIDWTLKDKVMFHRQRFSELFKARYLEMLPSLIKYENGEETAIDFLKVEVALRQGYDVVIGETAKGNIQVIGYTNSRQSASNPETLFATDTLRHADINFLIPEFLRLPYYQEITYNDNCETGNFIVLRNKTMQYVSDYYILTHYVDELSEIVLSRYSLSMQVKITTLFLGEPNDQSIEQIINEIYNGNPYIKGSKLFDPQEQIYHMQNEGLSENFQELKREYQNKIAELNTMLGINSLGVDKESGVSESEANSNTAFTTTNANVYLDGRNNGLKKLNKRYGLEIEAIYNDEVVSSFTDQEDEGGDDSDDNNDTV